MASVHVDPRVVQYVPPHIEPQEVYYGSYELMKPPIKLRIATGGAGQSGLIRALSDAFIDDQVSETGCEKFAVAWLKSDTAGSFNYLAQASADLSITYHPAAEDIAMQQGFTDRSVYAWRDHFMLVDLTSGVGPTSNPANLTTSADTTIQKLFSQIFRAAAVKPDAIRFLSRYDKSATNIKEASIWTTIGQVPWAYPYSEFYHRYTSFPFQALEVAAKLGEYTLVDRGTWYGVPAWVRQEMKIYMEGHDSDPNPILLNPAHVLVGTYGANKGTANAFADWMIRDEGGQKVIASFAIGGEVLYTKAPLADDVISDLRVGNGD
ncbi:MAG: hypothetical protein Q9222_006916 [Ikaeria aurantiellina]